MTQQPKTKTQDKNTNKSNQPEAIIDKVRSKTGATMGSIWEDDKFEDIMMMSSQFIRRNSNRRTEAAVEANPTSEEQDPNKIHPPRKQQIIDDPEHQWKVIIASLLAVPPFAPQATKVAQYKEPALFQAEVAAH